MSISNKKKYILGITDLYRVDENTGCWIWTGYKNKRGYGRFRWDGPKRLAHVVMWERVNGLVQPGLELDHQCNNPSCVNPDHLKAMPHIENCRRSKEALKTHCVHGHKRTPQNTEIYIRNDKYGKQYKRCLICYAMKYPTTKKICPNNRS